MLTARAPDQLDERLLALVGPALVARRWFPVKGVAADLVVVGTISLVDPAAAAPAVEVRVLLVRARAGAVDALLQVPLAVLAPGELAPDPLGELDGRTVVDAVAHPAFLRAWLAAATGPGGTAARVPLDEVRPITGEQSNSSVVLGAAGDPDRGILKVVRALQAGANPDIDVPRRLAEVGDDDVPAPRAWLQATWTGPDGAPVVGDLGVVSAFVEGAQDGFELACAMAGRHESFADLARELGAVTARLHDALARVYPTAADDDGPARLAGALHDRFAWALAAVPELEPFRAGVEATCARVAALPSTPPRQRVHGDLHLGQVLRASGRWLVLDFEGEPLAPLEARVRPDLAVRDVAGLLRSFDYAAAVGGLTGEDAAAWTSAARAALHAGYASSSAGSSDEVLVRALELDKTLYEAVYESRNRPTWLPIPLAGLHRLTS
ncbi:phosphotransferase [Cellulomonas composti]|uniref:Maltokinase n=1 Tax=Cellulomonas composti TaxID=266130 RepID=A0A511JC62_9CELL|nr:phosphotransferase [Cellulomonas composti]GEL95562.1 hypothetical protein CCO02nite_22200 [Cellulomonas composti]